MTARKMSDEEVETPSREDRELEREVRARRRFSLAEAIGRLGGDLVKGASPVTRKRQAELEIEQYLESWLADSEGALLVVLLRRVRESEALLESAYDRPLDALASVAERILGSRDGLRRFVGEVDAEWGRIYSERPYFDSAGTPPRPGDPYTVESVGAALTALLARLEPSSD
jgi:hypothetical protein